MLTSILTNMKKNKNLFIVIEGGDGAGKSVQSLLLKKYLEENAKLSVVLTREPGGGEVSENIRKILLNPKLKLCGLAELFLYEAARVQHIEGTILPALKQNKTVICDRFIYSTVAYQGFGRKLSLPFIEKLNKTASLGLVPDIVIYIDAVPNKVLNSAKLLDKDGYGKDGDRMEQESIKFHKAVRKGFLFQSKKERNFKLVKRQETSQKTQQLVRKIVDNFLKS
jgi:dTMP kinase